MRSLRWHLSVAALLLSALPAAATQIQVIALTSGKATVVIDNGRPRTLAAGQVSPEGVRLVGATPESAVVEFDGKRHTLMLGTSYRESSRAAEAAPGRSADRGTGFAPQG